MKRFFLLLLFLLMLSFSAEAASRYVVTNQLAPVFEDLDDAKKAPKGGWKIIDDEILPGSSYSAMLAYGDVVQGSVKNDWLFLNDENFEGFVELSALTPLPQYEAFKARSFQVLKNNLIPYLLPGKLPISNYSKFTLPRGAVVMGEGRAKNSDGKSWILCSFSTDSSSTELDEKLKDKEIAFAGSDNRYAWLLENDLIDLSASKPDLKRVQKENLIINANDSVIKALLKNGFYIDSKPILLENIIEDDLIDLYNDFNENTPKFITADCPLHVFHLYFDRALRKIEENFLIPRTVDFVQDLKIAFNKLPKPKSNLEKLAYKNVSNFIALNLYLLDRAKIPNEIKDFADGIMNAEGAGENPFTELTQDFSLFTPRGHYSLTDDLKTYFRVTYLLGTNWPIDSETGAAATLILNKLLDDKKVAKSFNALYSPITTLVGTSNVNSHEEFSKILAPFKISDLGNSARVEELMETLDNSGKNSVIQKLSGKKFAILPRRITFDAFIFHSLTYPDIDNRTLPDTLDVMAVLGSKAALNETKNYSQKFKNYADIQKNLINQLKSWLKSKDGENIYSLILDAIRSYVNSNGSKQFFANSPAWQYKKLITAEGSMTELKHDTILYAEQSGAEMGEGDTDAAVAGSFKLPIPRGYVEPVPELFEALEKASRNMSKILDPIPENDDFQISNLKGVFETFSDELKNLSDIAKRAQNDSMTYDDFVSIKDFRFPSLFMDTLEERDNSELKMALVADVATDAIAEKVLYMATGAPRKLHVYVNDKSGGFRVTEGYMYSYYTFTKPLLERRLTDDSWKSDVYDAKKQNSLNKLLPDWYEKIR